jgi:superfamily II DNA/RNA helicase
MWYQFLDVACALNFDLHSSVREYSHRVKRIARAGRGGSALLLMLLPSKVLLNTRRVSSVASTRYDEAWKRVTGPHARVRLR